MPEAIVNPDTLILSSIVKISVLILLPVIIGAVKSWIVALLK